MGGRKTKLISAEEETPKAKSPEKLSKAKSQPKADAPLEHASGGKAPEKKAKRPVGPRIKKVRGKKYQEAKKRVEPRAYAAEEAIKLVKETSTTEFDAAVDVHINLGLEKDKPEHQLRSFLALPHGTGKTVKVLVFAEGEPAKKAQEAGADLIGDEALIESIAQGKLPDIDAVVATPAFMPRLAPIARFLGPKGLMPTPKTGTVVEDPALMVKEFKQGRIEIRTEAAAPIVHLSIGRVSSPDAELLANLKAVVAELNRLKPAKISGVYLQSLFLAPTMGPSIKVDLATLS
ncbi:MAG: 50S ribosomal protein L1 [Patescibacteria group bacterium]